MGQGSEWSDFQARVRELLQMRGHAVTEEELVGHKKVDLLVEERSLGAAGLTAVECKIKARRAAGSQGD